MCCGGGGSILAEVDGVLGEQHWRQKEQTCDKKAPHKTTGGDLVNGLSLRENPAKYAYDFRLKESKLI